MSDRRPRHRRPDSFLRAQGNSDPELDDDLEDKEATELDTLTTAVPAAQNSDPRSLTTPATTCQQQQDERESQALQNDDGFTSPALPAPARGHSRSASHGGSALPPGKPVPPSVLKKASTLQGHRRVFSHGQITFRDGVIEMGTGSATGEMSGDRPLSSVHLKGHRRTGSKTEFILPPGHEERERRRASAAASGLPLQRTGSHRGGSAGQGTGPGSTAHHRRHPSRSDSLAFSFRGHSRQASRTDSIYTLRNQTTNTKRSVFPFCRKNRPEPETKHRLVVPNHCIPADVSEAEHPNATYLDNYVRTTKYTVLSFLPKNLFEQFHRFANLYFLFIVLLNWVPAINAFGKEISMLPVIFVLGVTAIKDIFEDRRRFLSDKRVNNSTCRVYNGAQGRYVKCLWKDLKVGDIVHLSCDEMIPADILVLTSSDEHGICFIDTQNLDGEANLKQREVPRGFVEMQSSFQPSEFRSKLECDVPTTKIYRFHGSIIHMWGERVPVGKDNLLLRECVLKNTNYIEGLVVYAGHESKAMLNNGGPRYKRSKLERQMNLEVVWCVVILLLLCFIGAVGSGLWLNTFTDYVPFLNKLSFEDIQPAFEGFLTFWTFVIILQIIIPLSLYVTIEMTKLAQVYLIHQDVELYDDLYDKRTECRALNIPEELGQVQYIFCDKTGTLTENNMVFKRCTINGIDYGHNSITAKGLSRDGAKQGMTTRAIIPVNPSLAEHLNSIDIQRLIERRDDKGRDSREPTKEEHQSTAVQDFFLLLAVCNTVIVAKHPHRDTMNASGIVPPSAAISDSTARIDGRGLGADNNSERPPSSGAAAINMPQDTKSARKTSTNSGNVADSERIQMSTSPSPPLSMMSTASSTAPLRPDPSLVPSKGESVQNTTTPKRPDRLLGILPTKPALSPIASSPEEPQTESPFPRPRHLQLPSLLGLSKLVSASPLGSKQQSRPVTPTPSNGDSHKPIYEAESPDELALVDAANAYNCRLLKRTPMQVVVSLPGDGIVDFEVLHILPFDSIRKRMSVILRHPVSGERTLYTKGADSAMFSRLSPASMRYKASGSESTILERTQEQLNSYAKLGLRVLVMAKKVLQEHEYQEWAAEHRQAEGALQGRDRLLFDSYNRMESNLTLLGATGIEDKLQEGVPNTIYNLRAAGIVVWVLTGDKQETAVNIAYSCKLFSSNMEIIKLNARSRDAAETTIKYYINSIENEASTDVSRPSRRNSEISSSDISASQSGSTAHRALVVDGKTLIYILDKRAALQESFLQLASKCSSVLCCRATPLQKAYIVRIVKEEIKAHTLAIGDGANDVSMIQTADVGIGISGQEGMQAVMASDFAISRFKFLERLLLVHGHWNYDRLARMVLYFFYKNASFVFTYFWYQLFCGFSGAVMIDQMYLMLYNLLFTSLPPMAIGVFDQDVPDTLLQAQPKLYRMGRLGTVYKPYSFWINMLDALYQSLVIFFIAFGAYYESSVGIWEFGTVMCTQCLFVQSLHMALITKSWTIVHWMSIVVSVLLYFVFALLYNGFCINCLESSSPFWVMQNSMGTVQFWVITLLSCVLALLPRAFMNAIQNTLFPSDVTLALLARTKASRNQTGISRDRRSTFPNPGSVSGKYSPSSRTTSQSSVLRFGAVFGEQENVVLSQHRAFASGEDALPQEATERHTDAPPDSTAPSTNKQTRQRPATSLPRILNRDSNKIKPVVKSAGTE